MRKFVSVVTLCVVCAIMTGCQYVDTGHVGVRVNFYGNGKGVDPKPLSSGRTFYNPMTEAIYEFPIFEQNYIWSGTDAITFNDKTGSRIRAEVAIQYSFIPDKVPELFTRLRKDAEYIGHNYLKTQARDKINREAKKLSVTDIFGAEGSAMLDRAKEAINQEFLEEGIQVHMLSFNSDLEVDERIRQSINAVITATQEALAAENKVKQIKAESDQKIEEARGISESLLVRAKKEAEANEVLTQSLSPELLKYKAMEKWDGVLPKFSGSGPVPFVDVTKE